MGKYLLPVMGTLVVALAILGWLLLEANESIGNLESDLATATEINSGNLEVIEGLRRAQAILIDGMAFEEQLERDARAAREAQLENLERELAESRARLTAAVEGLSDADALCVKSSVPDSLIDSLYVSEGSGTDEGD